MHEEEYTSLEQRIAGIEAGQRAAARAAEQRRLNVQQTMEKLENDPEK
jgi:hypothetical protein